MNFIVTLSASPDDVTDEEEKLLVMYIAKYNREHDGRDSTRLYKMLVNSVRRIIPSLRLMLNA